jgi:hypothetical protein
LAVRWKLAVFEPGISVSNVDEKSAIVGQNITQATKRIHKPCHVFGGSLLKAYLGWLEILKQMLRQLTFQIHVTHE